MASLTKKINYYQTWKENIKRSIGKSRKVRGGNYVQIATVDANNNPTNRTVVFRGWLPLNNGKEAMKMITDSRSEKVKHIQLNNKCEMVWWFSKSSEQYRIFGELETIGEENTNQDLLIARKQQWGNLSDSAREQFYWTTPGIKYTEVDDDSKIPKGGRDVETNKVLPPPSNFLLLLLYPMEVKYLCLRDNYSQFDQLAVVKKENVEENDDDVNLKSEQGDGVLENEKKEVWKSTRVNP